MSKQKKSVRPRVFIGSSSECLEVADAIQEKLGTNIEATVWDQDVCKLSESTFQSLVNAANESEFAIFVFNHDDVLVTRGRRIATTRDNVIFELGLFTGKLGAERTFIVVPKSDSELRIPSDLAGVTYAVYDSSRKNQLAALGPVCRKLRAAIAERFTAPDTCIDDSTKDLSGRWEGWYLEEIDGRVQPTAHEITHSQNRVAATAWGPNNESRSVHAWIEDDLATDSVHLHWTYRTSNRIELGANHGGLHFLKLVRRGKQRFLEGGYFNDRIRRDGTTGCGGRICVRFVGKNKKNALDYDSGIPRSWGIPKPTKIFTEVLKRLPKRDRRR